MKRLSWLLSVYVIIAQATLPVKIPFKENETVDVQLSRNNINRLIVYHDRIKNIYCPENNCIISANKQDISGSSYLSLVSDATFTLYITTENGHNLGVQITPIEGPAITAEFVPMQISSSLLPKMKSGYLQDLESMMTTMIRWQAGWQIENKSMVIHPESLSWSIADIPWAKMKIIAIVNWQNKQGRIIEITNINNEVNSLSAQQFYYPGVLAIVVRPDSLVQGETGHIFIVSN